MFYQQSALKSQRGWRTTGIVGGKRALTKVLKLQKERNPELVSMLLQLNWILLLNKPFQRSCLFPRALCAGCPQGGAVARSAATDSHEEVCPNPEAPSSQPGRRHFQRIAAKLASDLLSASGLRGPSLQPWRPDYRRAWLTAGQGELPTGAPR